MIERLPDYAPAHEWLRSVNLGTVMRSFFLAFALCSTTLSAQTIKCALVAENGYYKAIDSAGNILADSLREFSNDNSFFPNIFIDEGMFSYVVGGWLGFRNVHNRVVVPPIYTNGYHISLRGGSWGERDFWTKDIVTRFVDGLAIVNTKGQKFGIINNKGILVADTIYDYIDPPSDGLYAARIQDTLYLVNRKGKNILPFPYRTDPRFYGCPRISDGLLCVMVRKSNIPYVDFNKLTYDQRAAYKGPSSSDLHTYKVGFVNTSGRLVIDTVYQFGPDILTRYDRTNERHCMPSQRIERPILQDDYFSVASDFYRFSGGRCLVWTGKGNEVINVRGKRVFSLNNARGISNMHGFFSYYLEEPGSFGTWSRGYQEPPDYGIYNSANKMISPPQYRGVKEIDHGLFEATTYRDGVEEHWAVDSLGNKFAGYDVSSAWWNHKSHPESDTGSLSVVKIPAGDGKRSLAGLRNKEGQWVIQPVYGAIRLPKQGLIACSTLVTGPDGRQVIKWGYMDGQGTVVIPFRYDRVEDFRTVTIP